MQTNKSFEIQLAFGEDGEHDVAKVFMVNGWSVVPMYQFKGKDEAPKLFLTEDSYVLPDLICFKDGRTLFIEVKTKNQFTTKASGGVEILETGYHENHFIDYKKVQYETGIEVLVVFNHLDDGMFITPLEPYHRIWDGRNCATGCYIQKPTVFYTNKEHKPLNQFFNII